MKKVLFSVAVVSAFAFASCGGPSVCDCVNAGDDEDLQKKCDEAYNVEEMSEDEVKDLMEEASKCESDDEGEEGSEE